MEDLHTGIIPIILFIDGIHKNDNNMKKKMIYFLLLLCCSSLYSSIIYNDDVSIITNNAQECRIAQVVEVKDTILVQERIRLIKSFYNAYMINGLSSQYSNDLIKKRYLTKRLIEKIERVTLATGADPIIRAQDFTENAIETLNVRHLQDDWFVVDYKWNVSDDAIYREIPLKVIQVEGQCLIDYITPEWNGTLNGDTLLCSNMKSQPIDSSSPLIFLNTFYSAYLYEYCNMPENLSSRLSALREQYFSSKALAQFEETVNKYYLDGFPNYDLLIDFFDFDCLWIPSTTYTQLDKNTYQMRYLRWNNYPVIIIVGLIETEGKYKIDSIRIEK